MQLIPILHILFYLTTLWLPNGVTKFTISSGNDQKVTWIHQASGAWQATTEDGKDAGLWTVDGLGVSVSTNGHTTKTDLSQFVGKVAIKDSTATGISVCGKRVIVAYSDTTLGKSIPPRAVLFSQDDKDAPFAKQVVVTFSYDGSSPPQVCEVHHVPMRLVVTSFATGWSGLDTNYMAAASRLFPHVPSEVTSTLWNQKNGWVCDECIKARREWEQSHK